MNCITNMREFVKNMKLGKKRANKSTRRNDRIMSNLLSGMSIKYRQFSTHASYLCTSGSSKTNHNIILSS